MESLDLGASLRALREARCLSLGRAAADAGVPKATLFAWEAGGRRPRGAALARLLDALETEPRLRARLLHAADPAFARVALANTPVGAPVDVGMVIRAMRSRRGMTQTELARAAGVTQAAVTRWESGEDVPSGESLHRACFALGASADELVALACAQGEPLGQMPNDPEAALAYVRRCEGGLQRTDEVVSLGLEAELWRRSARDRKWDPLYCRVLGRRAHNLLCDGRLGEAEETARRALRRVVTPDDRQGATAGVGALVHVARHREDPPQALLGRLTAWNERLPESLELSWMVWERARLLAQVGREDEALEETERAVDMLVAAAVGGSDTEIDYNARKYRSEVLLETSRPERAQELWPELGPEANRESPLRLMMAIPAWHAAGESVPESWMETVRAWVSGVEGDTWRYRESLASFERDQARLLGPSYFATSS